MRDGAIHLVGRSIPACAGEPIARTRRRFARRVYPRVRGGTVSRHRRRGRLGGLSPRARGNLVDHLVEVMREGSIPACAGEPLYPQVKAALEAVYPRVRGGTVDQHREQILGQGLSPRARGNRVAGRADDERPGSIPACAGEPSISIVSRFSVRVYPRVRGGTE